MLTDTPYLSRDRLRVMKLWTYPTQLLTDTPYLSKDRLRVMKLDRPREMKKKGTT